MSKCCIQRLCVKCVSKWLLVKSGVPQGSGLGPILFLVFINDMLDVVKNTCKLFADDKKLLAKMDSLLYCRLLYCTYVRSQLEFEVAAWNLYRVKNIDALELVQRATKRAPGLSRLSYEARLA